jgi:hypothetical protein
MKVKAGRQAISSYIDSMPKKSPSYRIIRIPMSKIYLGDIIRLFDMFKDNLGEFHAEVDTDRRCYHFSQDNYGNIRNIDKNERVEAILISYYGGSFYPALFMVLSSSCAAIIVNDKYRVTYGFLDDVQGLVGRRKRALDVFDRVRMAPATAAILLLDVIIILVTGIKGIYVTTLELSSLALLLAIGGILLYAGRNYYHISLDEEPGQGFSSGAPALESGQHGPEDKREV